MITAFLLFATVLPLDFAADFLPTSVAELDLGFAMGIALETDLFEFSECRTRLFRGFPAFFTIATDIGGGRISGCVVPPPPLNWRRRHSL